MQHKSCIKGSKHTDICSFITLHPGTQQHCFCFCIVRFTRLGVNSCTFQLMHFPANPLLMQPCTLHKNFRDSTILHEELYPSTAQDGFASLSCAHGIEYSGYESPGMQKTYFANAPFERLCTSRHVLTAIFSPHTSACISESAFGSHPVFAYSVALFQCFRMVRTSFVQLKGGERKCTKKSRTPLARSTIEPSAQNGFCRPSGKRLQLETWDMNIRGIGL